MEVACKTWITWLRNSEMKALNKSISWAASKDKRDYWIKGQTSIVDKNESMKIVEICRRKNRNHKTKNENV